ncbi:MAG: DNA alkylation repair protein [Nocardioidaceae bacterium]|nr:DNA alkylation repair protein [Nocardioidaceae bacterium]NUS51874.1 DNA alkylation repair protein [Nocardioidaceae bacterium]
MPDAASTLARLVRDAVAAAGDPAKAPGMQAYMRSAMPFRGVQAGPLAAVCRSVFAAHPLPGRTAWEACVRELWDGASYREERYAAIALTGHPRYRGFQDPRTLPLYEHLVVTGAWWDHVDTVASNRVGPLLGGHADAVTPVLRAWAVADDLWLRRTAVIAQLARKGDTDLELLRYAVEANLEGTPFGREFFVRKAIGWALRQHARTDPVWVRAFVAEHEDRLSGLSRREALKHL